MAERRVRTAALALPAFVGALAALLLWALPDAALAGEVFAGQELRSVSAAPGSARQLWQTRQVGWSGLIWKSWSISGDVLEVRRFGQRAQEQTLRLDAPASPGQAHWSLRLGTSQGAAFLPRNAAQVGWAQAVGHGQVLHAEAGVEHYARQTVYPLRMSLDHYVSCGYASLGLQVFESAGLPSAQSVWVQFVRLPASASQGMWQARLGYGRAFEALTNGALEVGSGWSGFLRYRLPLANAWFFDATLARHAGLEAGESIAFTLGRTF